MKGKRSNNHNQNNDNPNRNNFKTIQSKLMNGSAVALIGALSIVLLGGILLNIQPQIEIFDRPAIERLGELLSLKGFLTHIVMVWIWRVVGIGLAVWLIARTRKSFIFWFFIAILVVSSIVGPQVISTYFTFLFGIGIWAVVQTAEVLPYFDEDKTQPYELGVAAIAYAWEITSQIWMYPPYSSVADFRSDLLGGGIVVDRIDFEGLALSLVAIFSFELIFKIIKSLRHRSLYAK